MIISQRNLLGLGCTKSSLELGSPGVSVELWYVSTSTRVVCPGGVVMHNLSNSSKMWVHGFFKPVLLLANTHCYAAWLLSRWCWLGFPMLSFTKTYWLNIHTCWKFKTFQNFGKMKKCWFPNKWEWFRLHTLSEICFLWAVPANIKDKIYVSRIRCLCLSCYLFILKPN